MKRVIYSDRNILFRRGRRNELNSFISSPRQTEFLIYSTKTIDGSCLVIIIKSTFLQKMKKLISLLLISTFFVFSCKKEAISNNSLAGNWQWVMSTGGIAGKTFTPVSEGYERNLTFTYDSKYLNSKNNITQKSGKFEIIKAKSIYKTELIDFIKFDDGTMSAILSQTSEELILANNNYDGFTETFKRKN